MLRWQNRVKLAVLVLVALVCWGKVADAAEVAQRRAVIVVMDGLMLEDVQLTELSGFDRLVREGAAGLVNTATGGARIPENTLSTVSAGRPVAGGKWIGMGFNREEEIEGEPAGHTYRRKTGVDADGTVLHTGLAAVKAQACSAGENFYLGSLGEAVRGAGLKTACYGNRDVEGEKRRPAVILACDQEGVVDAGDVGERTLESREAAAFKKGSDYRYLSESLARSLATTSLVVVDLGDIFRLNELKGEILPQKYRLDYEAILKQADSFLGEVLGELEKDRDILIVVSTCPPSWAAKDKRLLGPVFIWGRGFGPGVLTSPSTRQQGLVTLSDLAPTVLAHLGVPVPRHMVGRPVSSVLQDEPLPFLAHFEQRTSLLARLRPPIIQGYVFLQILAVTGSVLAMFFRRRWSHILSPLLLGLSATPLAFLVAGAIPVKEEWSAVVVLLLISVLMTGLFLSVGRLRSLALVSGFTFVLLAGDVLSGSNLIKSSIFGYDLSAGARYYGIGNEYMGVFIGSGIFLGGLILEEFKLKREWWLPVLAATTAITLFPFWGANVGGGITAIAGLGSFLLCGKEVRRIWPYMLGLILMIVIVIGGVGLYDLAQGTPAQSHLGMSIELVRSGGGVELLDIIGRKLSTNWRLIRYTIWTRVFLTGVAALAVLMHWPRGLMAVVAGRYPVVSSSIRAELLAAGAALLANDSGIVAAAMILVPSVLPFLIIIMSEKEKYQEDDIVISSHR